MERLSNGVSTEKQRCKIINLRNPEDGDDTFSETSVKLVLHSTKSQKTSLIKKGTSSETLVPVAALKYVDMQKAAIF
jgi:hypothetical protein